MKSACEISIIIPVYNSERYLRETLNSVQSQTFKEFEAIIVNDGSTDSSEEIILDFVANDNRYKYFKISNSGGPAKPRNIGLDNAVGRYICFLDSDDVWNPRKLELQVKYMASTGFKWTFMVYQTFFNEPLPDNFGPTHPYIPSDFTGRSLKNIAMKSQIGTSTIMLDRQVFEQIGYFDVSRKLVAVEDFDFWLRVSMNYDLGFVESDEIQILYRKSDSGISADVFRQQLKRFRVLWKHKKKLKSSLFIRAMLRTFAYLVYQFIRHAFKGSV